MKEKLKKNSKVIVAFVIGVIIASGGAYAATTITSSDISYDNSTSGLTSTNMKGAIDELYEKLNIKPCVVIKGTGMDANDEIKCGTEEFYVMGTAEGDSIITLTKYPIEGGVAVNGSTVVDLPNPSYAQNKNCGNGSFLCYGMGFAGKYKSVLKKIGLSDSIEVRKPTLSDLNKVGCSFSIANTAEGEPSGNCTKFPWLSGVVLNEFRTDHLYVASASSLYQARFNGISGFDYYEKLMVVIPIKNISL